MKDILIDKLSKAAEAGRTELSEEEMGEVTGGAMIVSGLYKCPECKKLCYQSYCYDCGLMLGLKDKIVVG